MARWILASSRPQLAFDCRSRVTSDTIGMKLHQAIARSAFLRQTRAPMIRRFLLALALVFAAPALAQDGSGPAPVAERHEWPFEESDLPPDPGYRFGRLDNGMRYVIRPNGTPAGQGMVYFWVDAGSVAESEEERGYAHFIEHMAFNGSTKVPEGEMIKLLEREGLAFGAGHQRLDQFRRHALHAQPAAQRSRAARHRADADARDRQRADLQPRGGRAREGHRALRAAGARHVSAAQRDRQHRVRLPGRAVRRADADRHGGIARGGDAPRSCARSTTASTGPRTPR